MKEETEDIGMLFKKITERLEKSGNEYFSTLGVTLSQVRVLHFIHGQPQGKTTQKELEDAYDVSHPTINGILKRLEKKNLIRTNITTNRRLSKEVCLTEEGFALLKETNKSKISMKRIMAKNFTKQEIAALKDMLKRIADNLSE